ncbi:hypothetical protein AXF42_Ash015521 [Apostasia shenzhenica]|uniref:DUF599 domain-containing protein n=1 Tax=Apostasia shenzhenica TaxID=1088818 RepID=A0A2I0AKQ5_9ASPA|nr:hypothetical protein AXF42_Ash015521 [Apostasia shenzhenica]
MPDAPMEKQLLDFILVPAGLAAMAGYHIWLLRRVLRHPTETFIGLNAISRRIWVQAMMEDPMKTGVLAVQTLRNNIMASALMASTAIMLCSLITVLITGGSAAGNSMDSIKFFAILLCFLLSFLLNVQSVRYFSHASILINVPVKSQWRPTAATAYVAGAVNMGGYFWSMGLRVCYFSFPLFFWIFGPIPMAACCLVLIGVLYFLDIYSGGRDGGDGGEGAEGMACVSDGRF